MIEFLFVESRVPNYQKDYLDTYIEKVSQLQNCRVNYIKSPSLKRSEKEKKKEREAQLILKSLAPDDILVLLDENGRGRDSVQFAKWLRGALSSTKGKVVFLIGGAFGVDDRVRQRANDVLSFGTMTMSHLVAQIVLIEQVYRGLTIINEIPYHNE